MKTELANDSAIKNSIWSESIAVGDESFIKDIQQKLASRAQGRSVLSQNNTNTLKELEVPYNGIFAGQKDSLNWENTYLPSINQ